MSSSSFSRAGAIDLSQLAARAKAPAAPPPGRGGGRPGAGSYVVEVTEETFEAETIRRSLKHPVVVELYSLRVTGGQQLSDALADIANASDGKFLLARIDVDTAPGIVQALQLQAVPTVIALIGGRVAPLFQGVLPREQVQAYLDELFKAAVTNGIVGRADPVGGPAEPAAEEEAGPDPRFAAADEALERGDFAAAVAEFDRLLAANPDDAEPGPVARRPVSSPGLAPSTPRASWTGPPPPTPSRTSWPPPTPRCCSARSRPRSPGWSAWSAAAPARTATPPASGCSSCSRPSAAPTSGCSRAVAT